MQNDNYPKAFPLQVFPPAVSDFILNANQTLNHPVEYLSASVLFTASLAIGNTLRLNVKNGWSEVAVIYIAIVGKPGANKTHSLNFGIKPLTEKAKEYGKLYKQESAAYNQLDEKERLGRPQPIRKQLFINDITSETINQVHEDNPRGIGYYKDELIAWLKDLDRYRKGSDEQFWLSAFSNKPIQVNRANRKAIVIESPFIPIMGGIQPEKLLELFGDGRTANGFTDRILFVFPEVDKPYWKEDEMPQGKISEYEDIINRLLDIELRYDQYDNILPYEVNFSSSAKAAFIEWYNRNADEYNDKATPGELSGSIAKSDIFCLRLMLILQALEDASINQPVTQIHEDTVRKAIRLTEYFKGQAKKVRHYVKHEKFKLSKRDKLEYLTALPEEFNCATANEVAANLNLHLKTAEKYLEYFVKYELLYKPEYNCYRKKQWV